MLSVKQKKTVVNDIIDTEYTNNAEPDFQNIIKYVLDGGKRL